MPKSFKIKTLPAAGSTALLLVLAACSSNGSTRLGFVGDPGSSSSGGTASSSGGSSSSGGAASSSGGGASSSGGTASSSSSGGTSSSSGGSQSGQGLVGKIVVLSGNVVLGTSDKAGNLAQRVNALVPGTQPITGTVTRILDKTGQGLVDLGNGRTLLVDGLRSKVGETVTLALGGKTLGSGPTPLIGVNLLTKTPTAGSLATVGVLAGSDVALVDVNKTNGLTGKVATTTTNLVTGVTGGSATGSNAVVTVVGTVTSVLTPSASGGTAQGVATPLTGTLSNLGSLLGGGNH